ncbi:hypothetical protein [Phenylobacterium sp.]|jgi:hypothetical protein|uniref:hypothetical protein n=1 Tax=Phenylobacterium sp. TaxID=1871053 RepID=UPI002F91D555
MIASIVTLALWPHFLTPGLEPEVRRQRVGGWTAERRLDRFTGEVSCRLHRGPVRYESGVVTFRLGRRVSTANALYRVDAGPPRLAADARFEAVSLGARLRYDGVRNPTRGEVHIPYRLVQGAKTAHVQSRPEGAVTPFQLAGLDAAIASAADAGCRDYTPDFGRRIVVTRPAEVVLPPPGSVGEHATQ